MAMIPKPFINSVVSIGIEGEKGTSWIGTGFLVGKKDPKSDGFYPYLVTNTHIVKGNNNIKVRFIDKNTNYLKEYTIKLVENGETFFTSHYDSKIDISVIFLSADAFRHSITQFGFFDIDAHSYTSSEFIENGGDEGSSIFMLGYPMGLISKLSNSPICRMGCIARFDKKEIEEEKCFIVDIQNFPGNSGSPILTKAECISMSGTKAITKCVLLGIVNSYLPYQENLINSQTGQVVEIRSENSGLALANPVEYIKEVIATDLIKRGISI
ncbi:MAG: serine protease [Malacoplasma sp.]|nr:serine protease [Malacoplasma sp.]